MPRTAEEDALRLRRENEHLRTRIAQLQGEVWDLSGRLARALQPLELAAVAPHAAEPAVRGAMPPLTPPQRTDKRTTAR